MKDFHKVIYLWMMFGFNYDPYFISKVFKNESDTMKQHLQDKFEKWYDLKGTSAFFWFWSDLDTRHKHTLEDWVMDNYQG